MAWRVEESDVRAVIDTDPTINLSSFIDAANALTDYVSDQDTDSVLSSAMLKQIEKNLAAHFYARRDPQYQTKKTGDASAAFQGQTGLRLDSTYWGQDAMTLDVTGCLSRLNQPKRPVAEVIWLGKPKSEQTDYEDRD